MPTVGVLTPFLASLMDTTLLLDVPTTLGPSHTPTLEVGLSAHHVVLEEFLSTLNRLRDPIPTSARYLQSQIWNYLPPSHKW